MDRVITIIVLLFLHLHLFVLTFDELKTGRRPTLFSGEPLLSHTKDPYCQRICILSGSPEVRTYTVPPSGVKNVLMNKWHLMQKQP